MTCRGRFPDVFEGMKVKLIGNYNEHYLHGKSFEFDKYIVLDVTSDDAVFGFLKSIKGIGNKIAREYVKRYSGRAYSALLELELDGIPASKRIQVSEAIERHLKLREMLFYFSRVLNYADMLDLASRMSSGDINELTENPYKLVYLTDVSAEMLDKAGYKNEAKTEDRQLAHLYSLLKRYAQFYGKYVINENEVAKRLKRILKSEVSISEIVDNKEVLMNDDRLKLGKIHKDETEIIRRINLINEYNSHRKMDEAILNNSINYIEGVIKSKLSNEQINACKSIHHGVACVTGFPGTGKSVMIRAMEHYANSLGLWTMVLTPTGAAAKRLKDSGVTATTIHRAVKYDGKTAGLNKDKPLKADVFIIDEASMVSYETLLLLMRAMPKGSSLVLVGDADQLPPVELGRPFIDMVNSETIPVYRLNYIYRQKGGKLIKACRAVLEGRLPPKDTYNNGFYFKKVHDSLNYIVELSKRKSKEFGNLYKYLYRTMILSPVRKKGRACVNNLNEELSKIIGHDGDRSETIYKTKMRKGDIVMNIRNKHDKDIYNGDTGILEYDKLNGLRVFFTHLGDYVSFEEWEISHLERAFATTVHKAQGQETHNVIIPIERTAYSMWNRNMLYTAMTRAKDNVLLVTDDYNPRELMYAIVGRKSEYKTEFAEMLQKNILKGEKR